MLMWRALLCGLLLASPLVAARDELTQWPAGAAPEEVGRRAAARFLQSPHMLWEEFGTLHYAEVATWYGALTFVRLIRDDALSAQLVDRFEPLFGAERKLMPPATHVDHTVFGTIPLEIYIQTGRPTFRTIGLSYADGQWDNPTPEGLTNQTRFWIDDMYMITLVQAQAWRATGRQEYLDRTAAEMVVYLQRLQRPNGLFFHAPDVPVFWGRGNGWMAAGMTELLRTLPEKHPHRATILAAYRRMMASLLRYQRPDGSWRQIVDREEAWAESSSTGMFAFAFITGVKNGWLDAETYAPAARKAWLALLGFVNANGDVREVCVGTGAKNDLQYYLDRPRSVGDFHGQAPLLWSATALLR